jgi:hypothetical protein
MGIPVAKLVRAQTQIANLKVLDLNYQTLMKC